MSELHILDTAESFDAFERLVKSQPCYMVPIFTTTDHPAISPVGLVLVKFLRHKDDVYVIPACHSDVSLNMWSWLNSLQTTQSIWAIDKKKLLHALPNLTGTVIDGMGVEYMATGKVGPVPSLDEETRHFTYRPNLPLDPSYIPFMRLVAYGERVIAHLDKIARQFYSYVRDSGFQFHNEVVIPALTSMERSGIAVNPVVFAKYYPHVPLKGNKVYTEYFPYTTTGRITGRFNRFNTSAINKKDGSRQSIVSRFGRDGKLLMIDFESFHLRLVADVMGQTLPTDKPLHEYFASLYFNTDEITPELYEKSKRRTFELMYDDAQSADHIPFFKSVREFVERVACDFAREGRITSRNGRHLWKAIIEDPSPKKLFNYYLQVTEMEVSMQGIYDMMGMLGNCRSVPTIYTYDSIMLDCPTEEIPYVTEQAVRHLEQNGRFPIRLWLGNDYHKMINVTNVAKRHLLHKRYYLST